MMTNRERILSVYSNKMPDRIPIGIYNRYHRVGEAERKARNDDMGILDFFPVVSLLAPPWHAKLGYISEVKNSHFRIEYKWENGSLIQRRKYETPVGCIEGILITDAEGGSDWIKKHYIENSKDYKTVQYIIENTVFCSHEKIIEQRISDLGEDGILLGRVDRSPYQKLLIELVQAEKLILDLHSNPGPVEELMQVIDHRLDEQFDLVLESEIPVIWQPDNITADLTPPKFFTKYCLPYYQKHGKQCRDAGKIYAVHIDGRTNGIKKLIAEAPIDVIESFSLKEISGDLSIAEAKSIWPDKVICPNFPANLCHKSKEEIEQFLTRLIMEFGTETPFMLQISEDIPLDSYPFILPVLCSFMKKS